MARFWIFMSGTVFGAACVLLAALYWPGTLAKLGPWPKNSTVVVDASTAPLTAALPTITTSMPPAATAELVAGQPASADFATPVFTPSMQSSSVPVPTVDVDALDSSVLMMPVPGIAPRMLSDTFKDARGGGRVHDAIDIMAPRGTPVVAVADGRLVKLFNSKQGGLTLYQFDANETQAYYYAHLDRYAAGMVEGRKLKRGELVGYVGSTGNASPDGPHLHFAIFILGPEKNWWQGTAINPYPLLGGVPR